MNEIIIFCAEYLIYIAIIYSIVHVFLKHDKKNKIKNLIIILATAFFSWLVAHFLKNIIKHDRPDEVMRLIIPDDRYSFPSGHTTFMSALSFAVYGFDKRDGVIILCLSVIVGIARVFAGVHFWFDIVGGFILGVIIAYLILKIIKKFSF